MTATDHDTAITAATTQLLVWLRSFEALQEDIDFRLAVAAQARLRAASADLLPGLSATLAALAPPAELKSAHRQLLAVVDYWTLAVRRFLAGSGQNFGQAFIDSRRALCEGLFLAYALRKHYPVLQSYWLSDDAVADVATLDVRVPGIEVPLGAQQLPATDAHAPYALYVPESYTPARAWPLIVGLHGAYGHGHEYLWTWLRAARSRGYLVLAPKASQSTWSILNPAVDIGSIRAMLDEVGARYTLDPRRVYVSGLSDGGTFAYLLGLSCPALFAGVAPIAGVLHPVADALLRQKQGIELPLFVVHGARDWIFDARAARSNCALLEKLGYAITYTELPDWGHAYTNSINERLVLPWFESLVAESPS